MRLGSSWAPGSSGTRARSPRQAGFGNRCRSLAEWPCLAAGYLASAFWRENSFAIGKRRVAKFSVYGTLLGHGFPVEFQSVPLGRRAASSLPPPHRNFSPPRPFPFTHPFAPFYVLRLSIFPLFHGFPVDPAFSKRNRGGRGRHPGKPVWMPFDIPPRAFLFFMLGTVTNRCSRGKSKKEKTWIPPGF